MPAFEGASSIKPHTLKPSPGIVTALAEKQDSSCSRAIDECAWKVRLGFFNLDSSRILPARRAPHIRSALRVKSRT